MDLTLKRENLLEVLEIVNPLYLQCVNDMKYYRDFIPLPDIKAQIDALFYNCVVFSYDHTKDVIRSKRFLSLDMKTALPIFICLNKENISDELLLFNVFTNWSEKDLAGRSIEEKRKSIGEELLFSIRYGLMLEESFLNGPAKSGLLLPDEIDIIVKCIKKGKSKVKLPESMRKIAKPRDKFRDTSYKLSERTINGCTHFSETAYNCSSLRREQSKTESNKSPPKILLAFVRCWQILFD